MFYMDYWYLILVVPAIIIALIAQVKVKSTYAKYNKVQTVNGISGAEAARMMLDANGLSYIPVNCINGELTDHFDPKNNVINLSQAVYNGRTISAVGIACHEAGHAVQHAVNYGPAALRMAIIPVTNIASKAAFPLILLGFIFSFSPLILAGIICFGAATFFQLVTLPTEFNASKRAVQTISASGFLTPGETNGAKSVLSAAAMTYVAALLVSVMQLLRLIIIMNRKR